MGTRNMLKKFNSKMNIRRLLGSQVSFELHGRLRFAAKKRTRRGLGFLLEGLGLMSLPGGAPASAGGCHLLFLVQVQGFRGRPMSSIEC